MGEVQRCRTPIFIRCTCFAIKGYAESTLNRALISRDQGIDVGCRVGLQSTTQGGKGGVERGLVVDLGEVEGVCAFAADFNTEDRSIDGTAVAAITNGYINGVCIIIVGFKDGIGTVIRPVESLYVTGYTDITIAIRRCTIPGKNKFDLGNANRCGKGTGDVNDFSVVAADRAPADTGLVISTWLPCC
jgi:hypothetical protein